MNPRHTFAALYIICTTAIACTQRTHTTTTQAAARINLIFAYFTDNGQDGLHLACSHDGLDWKPLNDGKSFLAPESVDDRIMRDPCVILGPDDVFHMSWTSSWGAKGFGLAHSRNLIEWSNQQHVPGMSHEPKAINCWAPEIVYDDETNRYVLYWSTTIPGRFPDTDNTGDVASNGTPYNHRIYYTTTSDFKTFAPTKLLYDGGFNAIDANIVRDGKRWLMFIKDETLKPVRKQIRLATSDHATGPYGPASKPITDSWTEGPAAILINGQWHLYFDRYNDGRYGLMRSRDLEHWEDLSDRLHMPQGVRHGSVLSVSDETLARLQVSPLATQTDRLRSP